jgi:tetratricopeptide (TPR) repeat protein
MSALYGCPVTAFAAFSRLPAAALEAAGGRVLDVGIGGTGASRGIISLLAGIAIIAAIPLLYFAVSKILGYLRLRKEKSFIEELTLEAKKREEAGEFVSAALAYERLKKLEKAAELYESGRDFIKAAGIYESLGRTDKVSEMHEMAGDPERAAETCMFYGDFAGAARLFNQLGDKLRAAEALEHSGNKLAAARSYREAKDYLKASDLLRQAGMHKEAAEMYAISLAGSEAADTNLEKFYGYAVLLESAGDHEKAGAVLGTISKVDPDYRDVRKKIAALGVRAETKESEALVERGEERLQDTPPAESRGGEATLRSMIRAGGIEPRHSFRLWVQVLKVLDQSKKEGRLPEILTPDSIVIDSGNKVVFSEDAPKDFAYIAPEVVAGSPPDAV